MIKRQIKVFNILDFALYLFVATLPFKLIFTPIAFGFLVLCSLLFIDRRKTVVGFNYLNPILLLPIFYVINFIGLIFYSFDDSFFSKVDTQLLLFFIPLCLIYLSLDDKNVHYIKKVFVYAMTVFCVCAFLSLVYNLIVNFEHKRNYNFIQTSMYHFHYPYDALYINTAYIFLLFSNTFSIGRYKKMAIALLFFIFIVLSGVRLGISSFLLVTFVFFVTNFKRLFSFKLILIVAFSALLGFFLMRTSQYANDKFFDTLSKIGFKTEQFVSDIGEDYHKLTLREKLWSSASIAYKENPNKLFGYGPHGSRTVLDGIYLKQEFFGIEGMNSHNQYLTTLLNKGIFGLIFLLLIFLLALYKSYRSKSLENSLLVILTMIAFFTESMLERQKGVVFFALFITLIFIDNQLQLQRKLKQ